MKGAASIGAALAAAGGSEEGVSGKRMAVSELLAAIKAGDEQGTHDALESFVRQCQYEPDADDTEG